MVEKNAVLSITRQCDILCISRGVFYYIPVELTEMDLKLMEKLDELFTIWSSELTLEVRGG